MVVKDMFKLINLNPKKSKYIYGRRLLSEYLFKPRIFIETNERNQFPYWEGDNIRKSHIKHFIRYCDCQNTTYYHPSRGDGLCRRDYEVVYYGVWKLKMFEISRYGRIIQLNILKIYNWNGYIELENLKSRFKTKNLVTEEERITHVEYLNKLINTLTSPYTDIL
jgi:hypothetical protein